MQPRLSLDGTNPPVTEVPPRTFSSSHAASYDTVRGDGETESGGLGLGWC